MKTVWEGKHRLSITQYPSGKWGFVGDIPVELCYWKDGLFPQYTSKIFNTREEAEKEMAKLIKS